MSESFGARLRAERERREITLESISNNTKISVSLLDGLERDDVSRWPSGIFCRSYVRSYAQAVGLDPDAIVREFLGCYPDRVEAWRERHHPEARPRPAARLEGGNAAICGRPADRPRGLGAEAERHHAGCHDRLDDARGDDGGGGQQVDLRRRERQRLDWRCSGTCRPSFRNSVSIPIWRNASPDMLHIIACERCQNTACLKRCLARDSVRRW